MRMLFTIPQIFVGITALASVGTGTWYGLDALDARPVITKELKEATESLTETFEMADSEQTKILEGLSVTQQQLTSSVIQLQFETLATKAKLGSLDFTEKQSFCKLAKKLEYTGVEGCPD